MPVTKSAKKALRTAQRRHAENIALKEGYKKAVKEVKKAVEAGSKEVADLFAKTQSALDKAAKRDNIHPNKAARLKSRLAKRLAAEPAATPAKKATKAAAKPKTTRAKKAA